MSAAPGRPARRCRRSTGTAGRTPRRREDGASPRRSPGTRPAAERAAAARAARAGAGRPRSGRAGAGAGSRQPAVGHGQHHVGALQRLAVMADQHAGAALRRRARAAGRARRRPSRGPGGRSVRRPAPARAAAAVRGRPRALLLAERHLIGVPVDEVVDARGGASARRRVAVSTSRLVSRAGSSTFSRIGQVFEQAERLRHERQLGPRQRPAAVPPTCTEPPASGSSQPHSTASSVDLPEPDAPEMPRISPAVDVEFAPRNACTISASRRKDLINAAPRTTPSPTRRRGASPRLDGVRPCSRRNR